jgi:hypothetical protein
VTNNVESRFAYIVQSMKLNNMETGDCRHAMPCPTLPCPTQLPYPLICSGMLFITCPFQYSTTTANSIIAPATATTEIAIFSFPTLDNRSEEPLTLMLCHLMLRHSHPIRQTHFIAFLHLQHHLTYSLYPNLHLYFRHCPSPRHLLSTSIPSPPPHPSSIPLPTPIPKLQLPSGWP